MFRKRKLLPNCIGFLLLHTLLLLATITPVYSQNPPATANTASADTTAPKQVGPLPYPIHDRRGDFISSSAT